VNKSILFLSVTFPPRLSVASLRLYNYAKLFSENGWKVHVLSCKQNGEAISESFDLTQLNVKQVEWKDPFDFNLKFKNPLLKKIITKVFSFFIPYLSTWWPDRRFKSWRNNTLVAASDLIESAGITHVYSSFSPPSPHMVASQLKIKYKHLFWIAEFRDLMSFSHGLGAVKRYFAPIHFSYERNLLKHADEVLCVSQGHALFMQNKLGRQVNVLLNGCDFSLYQEIERKKVNDFTIVYTGNVYRKQNDLQLFFSSVYELIISKKMTIKVLFVGTPKHSFLLTQLKKYGLIEHVTFIPKQDHFNVRLLQKSAHMLLHFCWKNNTQEGNITGKLFEYISARVPILSIGEQVEVEELIKFSTSGQICKSKEEIVNYVTKTYFNYPQLTQLSNNDSPISKLNQFRLLEKRIL
jgi:glycosyltransferase involved in cell wall biosynthesis